jgi:hypothetical protein
MSIDYDAIRQKFISVVKDGVGTSLSTSGQVGSEFPSVIQRRPDGPKPDYPYIDLDILSTQDEGGWTSSQGVDSNGDLFYETHKELLINFRCYGGDAQNIMNDLSGYMRQLHLVQDDLRETLASSIVNVFNVTSIPIQLNDKWIESADFNLTFNTIDRITDTTVGYGEIEIVHLDGELFRSSDDENPLPVTVDAP